VIFCAAKLPKKSDEDLIETLKGDDFMCERKFRVLLYANETESETDNYQQTIQQFQNISYVKEIFCLQGGYEAFFKAYPFLCQNVSFEDVYPAHILDHIFLSSHVVSQSAKVLKNLKVNFVLNVTNDLPNKFENSQDIQISYCRIPIIDDNSQPIGHTFNEAFSFIERAKSTGSNVLIHCAQGRSRSVAITAAYVMKYEGMTYEQALQHIQKARQTAQPNAGFTKQLLAFESTIMK